MPTGRMPTTSSTERHGRGSRSGGSTADGEPEAGPRSGAPSTGGDGRSECPACDGLGWVRRDVPVGHPDFGKAFPCPCFAERLAERRLALLRQASEMAVLERMTFDTFQVDAPGNTAEGRRSLAAAKEESSRFAADPSGWLVLHGGFGCGKTHLAAAIVNACTARGCPALFLVVPDLLDHLRAAYTPGSAEGYDDRFEAVRDAPVLVLDDLGAQSPTPWAAEKLFQLLNHRYNAQLPTVITSNQDLDDLDARLRSRLGHFGFVRLFEIEAIDYRGGVAAHGEELSALHLYGEMTFQSWEPRTTELEADLAENLARAHATAREFAEAPSGWLVLVGDHGCGKTHLAAAIGNHVQRAAYGSRVVFVTAPDLLDYLRATFGPTTRVRYDQRFDEVRDAELLVLDDLGMESATAWAREKLFQLLNRRYAARLPTVITMSARLQDVHPWLRTRMLDKRRCTVFEIQASAYGFRTTAGAKAARRRRAAR